MQIGNFGFYSQNNLDVWKEKTNISQNLETSSKFNKDSSVQNTNEDKEKNKNKNTQNINGKELEADEVHYVRELESIDRNVKAHEAAHIAAGAGVVSGGASYGYTRGPDGKMYATSGEVPISIKKGSTPEETIQNARQIVAAAMAPADPSPQDYKVAASAMQMESQARTEQAQERAKKNEELLKKKEKQKQQKNKKTFFNDKKREYALQIYTQNQSAYQPRVEIAG